MTDLIMAWDSDDVLFPFTHAYGKFVGQDPHETWLSYCHFESWGITREQFALDLERFTEEGHFGMAEYSPLPEAVETFNRIQGMGVRSYVVTHKPNDIAITHNMQWLISHGMIPDGIVKSHDKSIIRTLHPDAVIVGVDDKPSNVRAMLGVDVHAYLLDAPWNQDDTDLPRIYRLSELVSIVRGFLSPVGALPIEVLA